MQTSLGVSAGTAGIGSALVTTDDNGSQTVEYRVLSADFQTHRDLGDLMLSSIDLMITQVQSGRVEPDGVAVTYRTVEQTHSIRSAAARQRREIRLIPETDATLAYLRNTGAVARYGTIAIADFGASGLTVSVLDQVDGSMLRSERTTRVSGDTISSLVFDHVLGIANARRNQIPFDRDVLAARCHAAKELLSSAPVAHIDIPEAETSITLTRDEFDGIVADSAHLAARFTHSVCGESLRRPQALALVGGGAHTPAMRRVLDAAFDGEIITVDNPEAAPAKGAALLAVSNLVSAYPAVGANERVTTGTATKVTGVLTGALMVGGLMLGYGLDKLTPREDENMSPAGTKFVHTPTEGAADARPVTRIPSYDPEATPTTTRQTRVVTPEYPGTRETTTSDPVAGAPSTGAPSTTSETTVTSAPPESSPLPLPDQPGVERPQPPSLLPGTTPSPGTTSETDGTSSAGPTQSPEVSASNVSPPVKTQAPNSASPPVPGAPTSEAEAPASHSAAPEPATAETASTAPTTESASTVNRPPG